MDSNVPRIIPRRAFAVHGGSLQSAFSNRRSAVSRLLNAESLCYDNDVLVESKNMPKALTVRKKNHKRVVVFGVFDLLHLGHVKFLAHAKRLGNELVVVLTLDHRVRLEKGRAPFHTARERRALLSALTVVDRVVFGDRGKRWTVIKRLSPHVIVLGPDQSADHPQIQEQLRSLAVHPAIKRYPASRSRKHASSSIRAAGSRQFRRGRSVS